MDDCETNRDWLAMCYTAKRGAAYDIFRPPYSGWLALVWRL